MKATWCVFALLANFLFLTATVDGSEELRPSSSWLSKGPFCSRTCKGGAGRFADDMFPPYRCSCSKSCVVFGDCCYDSPYRSTELRRQYEFVCISVIGRRGYRAVSSCPPGMHHHSCKANLGLMSPVTSSKTNITYANRYCAWCNGDKSNLITWNGDLSCPSSEVDLIKDPKDSRKYISKKFRTCEFKVRNEDYGTIDRLELRLCATINMISKCSPSWEDSDSAKKCASYEDPVFLYNKIYRNPDCAHCDFANLSFVECVPQNLKTEGRRIVHDDVIRYCLANSCQLDLGNGETYPLGDIFGRTLIELLCSKGERYDPNFNECREIKKG